MDNIYINILSEAENAYKNIIGNSLNTDEMLKAMKEYEEYVPSVLNNWQIIRSDLSVYLYTALV